ncbi:hypothetical protein KIN20_002229 [Parelaphostrongylus tenuis]|uniref:Uncharacterized protein n=1 Tax=Parelaphostrongylus tenuis TaxID=148309 RepID=A0AAD5LVB7_PARTN|nr:hypothetical protein KIN20_002229 [Parelaphostrongylus tenuis]
MIIVETAIESVLAVRVDFRATKWPLWCTYFSLENEEGEEKFFSDSTDLNERWLKLWEELIEGHVTGRRISLEDTTKLFGMHPFVDNEHLQSRKHKTIPLIDSKSFYRSLSMIWRRLDHWAFDPNQRTQLASESRWVRLADIRRRVFLEANKNEYENQDVLSGLAAGPKFDIEGRPHLSESSTATQDDVNCTNDIDSEILPISLEDPSLSSASPVDVPISAITDCANSSSSGLIIIPSSSSESNIQETGGAAELSGTVVRCSNCSNVCISSLDTAAIKNHCALHAVMEGRMLCSLYIHRAADRPQICPFCHSEVNVYKPGGFLHHLQSRHMHKARIIYDRYLFRYFPQQKIFSDPYTPSSRSKDGSLTKSDFIISCQRSNNCGVNPVVLLRHDKAITSSEIDIAIVKHILWHVRNDSFLELEPTERNLLTQALMIRLSSSHTRQVLLMAKKVAKQFNRGRELDVVKYINEKLDEIGCILFGVNKGFVYQMVFTRRLVRDQCGMQLYPPCICRICVNKELPRCPSDGRKRAFVAYTHPVVLHILEHLNDGELPEKITSAAATMRWKNACKIDGLRFKSASLSIKHVLDAHNDLVELSALDMILEDNGLFEIFHDALSAVFGDQAWQLVEALGFGSYEMKPCPKLNTLIDESNGHRPECVHPCDSSTPCTCSDIVSSQAETVGIPGVSSSKVLKSRIKTACLDMPKSTAACYEEFLNESEMPGNAGGSSSVVTIKDESIVDAVSSHEPFNLPSNSITMNSIVAPAVALVSVKVEESEEHSDISTRSGEEESSSSLSVNPFIRRTKVEEDREKKRRYRQMKKNRKRLFGAKRGGDKGYLPKRNIALPLKNVIQGSKTVAAALAAALETSTSTTDTSLQRRSSISRTQDDSTFQSRDEGESILALSSVSKRPRLLIDRHGRASTSDDWSSQAVL